MRESRKIKKSIGLAQMAKAVQNNEMNNVDSLLEVLNELEDLNVENPLQHRDKKRYLVEMAKSYQSEFATQLLKQE